MLEVWGGMRWADNRGVAERSGEYSRHPFPFLDVLKIRREEKRILESLPLFFVLFVFFEKKMNRSLYLFDCKVEIRGNDNIYKKK